MLKISFVGDLMCLKEQNEAIRNNGASQEKYDDIFRYVKPLLEESDYVIGNLETPIGSSGFSEEAICFNTPVEFLRAVKNGGIDFVSTANNHCLDRGIEGLEETIRNIDAEGLAHSGTYLTKEASEDIFLITIKGVKLAVVCSSFGTNSEVNGVMLPNDELWRIDLLKKQNKPARARFSPNSDAGHKMIADNVSSAAINNSSNSVFIERFLDKIKRAKEVADLVFIVPHIGGQYNPAPGTYTKYIVERISQLNPSLIIAGHPHVPLRVEEINGVFTAYSLGNFTFTPDVGYYISNCLAEYGLIVHSYWNTDSKMLQKLSFDIVKNVVGEDGISRVIPAVDLYNSFSSAIDKERLFVEAQAVACRVLSALCTNPINNNLNIKCLPPPNIIRFLQIIKYFWKKFMQLGLIGIVKTIYYNYKFFPIIQAYHLPLLVSSKTKIIRTKRGSIILTSPTKFAMLSFGMSHRDYSFNAPCFIKIEGKLIIHGAGKHLFAPGASLAIRPSGILEIGDNFGVGHFSRFIIASHSSIGNDNMHSWQNLYLDTDAHPIYDINGQIVNPSEGFKISDHVWIGARCSIMKGVKIEQGCVIAANSVVTKDLDNPDSIYAGSRLLRSNVRWEG